MNNKRDSTDEHGFDRKGGAVASRGISYILHGVDYNKQVTYWIIEMN